MPIYDDVMRSQGAQALGTEAVSEPDPAGPLQEITPDMYRQVWGTAAAGGSTGGGDAPLNPRQADRASDVGGQAGKIVRAAQSLLGTPYVWGGASSKGVDCSGLIYLAYKAAGINMPRVSYQQANYGRKIPVGQLKPGDLVAWNNSSRNDGADHIAIYLGGGRVIEAARPGTNVRISRLGNNEGAWGVRILGGN